MTQTNLAATEPAVWKISVQNLVEFCLRSGDLSAGFVSNSRALLGTRAHKKVQKSRPVEYSAEVPLSYLLETEDLTLEISGRADGIFRYPDRTIIEEIKSTTEDLANIDEYYNLLHWAQAKCYAYIYAVQNDLQAIEIQLTYYQLDSGEVKSLPACYQTEELAVFFQALVQRYLAWAVALSKWRTKRNLSIKSLSFPFATYRPGQRELAVGVYKTIVDGKNLFAQAPTGIGKTMATIFPAIKAVGEGQLEKIFYLTAKTITREVAESAVQKLRDNGLALKTLTLTAKEKICFRESPLCDPEVCEYARGYFDHVQAAVEDIFTWDNFTRQLIEEYAEKHRICPFEFALDLSLAVDCVICDYNYVFDPRVYLKRFFMFNGGNYAFLIDEAHNLVDRAREMFSAELAKKPILDLKKATKAALPAISKSLNAINTYLIKMRKQCEPTEEVLRSERLFDNSVVSADLDSTSQFENNPVSAGHRSAQASDNSIVPADQNSALQADDTAESKAGCNSENEIDDVVSNAGLSLGSELNLGIGGYSTGQNNFRTQERASFLIEKSLPQELVPLLEDFLQKAESWLQRNQPAGFSEDLLSLYFEVMNFMRTAELFDERFVTYFEKTGQDFRVKLFCLDPSALLREALKRGKAGIFFSATLTPLDYFAEILGGDVEDHKICVSSPFPPENLCKLVASNIRTTYKAREFTYMKIVDATSATVRGKQGNYLVFLPSYKYMDEVYSRFQENHPEIKVICQLPIMAEEEREEFLQAFSLENTQTLVGFAVMGGIFGEGIDLIGERLSGAVIVGVGLPQLCLERDIIRDYFQRTNGMGFEYAYMYPGMNKVLQAAGRVIRTETDRGVVLLIDARFSERRYRELLPREWNASAVVKNPESIAGTIQNFWSKNKT